MRSLDLCCLVSEVSILNKILILNSGSVFVVGHSRIGVVDVLTRRYLLFVR